MKPSPVASVVLFVGAAVLLYSAMSTSWFTFRGDDGGAGLFRVSFDHRTEWMWSDRIRAENVLAIVTGLFTLTAAALAGVAGGVLLKPGRSALAVLTLVFVVLAMACASLFAVLAHDHDLSFGAGFYLFWLASIGTLVATILGMSRPVAPVAATGFQGMPLPGYPGVPMGGPVASAPLGPPCPTCNTPAMFVAQYARHFCQRCNRYL